MKYAVVFLAFAATCAFAAWSAQLLALQIAAAWCALAFGGVGLAYAGIGPRAFLKTNGQLSWASYLIYGPYHGINALSLWGFRRSSRENDFDQIAPSVYLGCRLNVSDKTRIEDLGIRSVLDLTCEFSETAALRNLNYRCIPLLDTRAPSTQQLRDGAHWICERAKDGPVYVHCALGHGRSATFVAAHLMLADSITARQAVEKIKRVRPHIGLKLEQFAVLEKLEDSF